MGTLNFLPREGTAARILPWVIAVMVLLSGLAIAFGAALHGSLQAWEDVTARSLTVQVVSPETAILDRETEAAIAFLDGRPGIADVTPVPAARAAELLSPWLGEGIEDQNLPLPRMIDVTLAPGDPADIDALRRGLADEAPHARIDSHAAWLGDLIALSNTLEWLALGVIGLMGVATVAIIVFATLSRLAAHRENIELVHLMGARDGRIAREFQWRFLAVGFKGGLIALSLVAIIISVIVYYGRRVEAGLLLDLSIELPGFIALGALPFVSALMTMITARITVMRVLARLV